MKGGAAAGWTMAKAWAKQHSSKRRYGEEREEERRKKKEENRTEDAEKENEKLESTGGCEEDK